MNDKGLQVFESKEFGAIQVLEDDGKVLFNASQVASMLGYTNTRKAVSDHCRCVTKRYVPHPQSSTKTIEMNFIPEPDLYRLICGSRLESARRFERWVFEEVLPIVRKHGIYTTEEMAKRFLKDPRALEYAIRGLLEEKEKNAALTAKIEEDAHKVSFYDAVVDTDDHVSIANAAKLLNYKNMGPQKLFAFLKHKKVLMSTKERNNVPYQKFIDMGLFKYSESRYTDWRGETFVHYRPWVSQKGLSFINQLLLKSGYTPKGECCGHA